MRRLGHALLLLLVVAGCRLFDSSDQSKSKQSSSVLANSKAMAPGAIRITPANASIQFTGSTPLRSQSGQFAAFDGTLELKGNNPKDARIHIIVDMDSTTTDIRLLTKHLKGDEFFDVARFPTAEFVSESITPTGESGTYQVNGKMTIHGIQQPIVFLARIAVSAEEFYLDGTFIIRQSSFGMTEAARKTRDDVPVHVTIRTRRS